MISPKKSLLNRKFHFKTTQLFEPIEPIKPYLTSQTSQTSQTF
jgi:hypothetical protein